MIVLGKFKVKTTVKQLFADVVNYVEMWLMQQ